MAYYTDVDTGINRPLSLSDMEPSIWQGVKATFDLSLDANPLAAVRRINKYYELDYADIENPEEMIELAGEITGSGFGLNRRDAYETDSGNINSGSVNVNADDQGAGFTGGANDPAMYSQGRNNVPQEAAPYRRMSREAQQKEIDANDLNGLLVPDPHYNAELLHDVIAAKKTERARQLILQDQKGVLPAIANFTAGFAGGLLDPINLLSGLIPVVPAARVSHALANAASTLGRTAIRAGAGAASGAVGAALVEPLVFAGQQIYQADYNAYNSMQNIAFGAIMGAGMHAGAGAIRARLNTKRGIANEWEYARDDAASLDLLDAHRRQIEDALKASENMSPAERAASAEKAAQDFHNHIRRLAYTEKTGIADLYKRYAIDHRNGELAARSADDTIGRMADEVIWQAESLQDSAGFAPDNPHAKLSLYTNPENTAAIIDYFGAANCETAPREIIGIIGRQIRDAADRPNASAEVRRAWRDACDFVGAEYDKAWTPAQEKSFADAYVKYLAKGYAPQTGNGESFTLVRNKMLELYNEARLAGVEISPAMRRTFNRFNSIPTDRGYALLRQAIVELDNWREFAPSPESLNAHETFSALEAAAEANAREINRRPEHAQPLEAVTDRELAQEAAERIDAAQAMELDPAAQVSDSAGKYYADMEAVDLQDYSRRMRNIREQSPELAQALDNDAAEMMRLANEGAEKVKTGNSLVEQFINCELG